MRILENARITIYPSTLAIKWEQPLGKAKHKIDYKIIQIYMQIENKFEAIHKV